MFESYPDVVTVKELCQMLQIGKNTAYELLKNRSLNSIRIGRKFLIPKQSVIDFLGVMCYNENRIINGGQNNQSSKGALL
ncbi:MAG: helix-turn-helix domain-containing protein [Oscillospiraceae bacterium]|nr:helix-turn-helix domain-containing protein [Oscillospiraceae bacterium]